MFCNTMIKKNQAILKPGKADNMKVVAWFIFFLLLLIIRDKNETDTLDDL